MNATIKIILDAAYATTIGIGTVAGTIKKTITQAYADGSGAGKINLIFSKNGTLASSGSDVIDLNDSADVINEFGQAAAFDKVKSLYLKNTGANAIKLVSTIAGATEINLPVGGSMALCFGDSGLTLGDGTSDSVTVSSALGSTYELVILGEHTA